MLISFVNFRIHSILILILIVIVVILDPAYSDTDTHIPIVRSYLLDVDTAYSY